LETITGYVKEHFSDPGAPSANTALQQVPYSIWNAFGPDLLGEPLPSYTTKEDFERQRRTQLEEFKKYGVLLPDDFLSEISKRLNESGKVHELLHAKAQLRSESERLMQELQDRIKHHGSSGAGKQI